MPTLAPGVALPRTPLAQVASDYNEDEHFIALDALPPLPVMERASEYMHYDAQKGTGLPDAERKADGKINRMTREHLLIRNYSCRGDLLEYPVDRVEDAELGETFGIDSTATGAASLFKTLRRIQEKRVADLIFSTVTFGAGHNDAGPKLIQDPGSADAEQLVSDGHDAVFEKCGASPNTVIMSRKARLALGRNSQVRERVIYTTQDAGIAARAKGGTLLGLDALAEFFAVDQILVGSAKYDGAGRGAAGGASLAEIWDPDYLLFAKIEAGPSLEGSVQAGRTFVWDRFSGPGGEPHINPPYEEGPLNMIVAGWQYLDAQVFNPNAAHLFTGINAA